MKLLVIGGTGSLGREIVRQALEQGRVDQVVVFSRGDTEQAELYEEHGRSNRLRLVIGDVRDPETLPHHIGPAINCAAVKSVWACEQSPEAAARVNIAGAANVLRKYGHEVIFISTDKAVSPSSIYGAQKMVAERMHTRGGARVYRGVNFLGSRGSLLPLAEIQARRGTVLLTDPAMRRYVMQTSDAAEDVLRLALEPDMYRAGRVYIPGRVRELPIADLLREIADEHGAALEVVGAHPGEKLTELMTWPGEEAYEVPG